MDGNTTVKYLQSYLKQKDFVPGKEMNYFLKLVEEVGGFRGHFSREVPQARPAHQGHPG